ncbi:VOC family protein [Actinomycetes bacterium KLBMP 9759]
MIGKLRSVVLDCPDPLALAPFYKELLGGEFLDGSDETWVVLVDPDGRRIAFQKAGDYRPPRFPDPHASQQFHLDVLVEDVEAAQPRVLELGATLVESNDDEWFRVYTDPVGHPFCLVWLH